jgi:hypothetical protein
MRTSSLCIFSSVSRQSTLCMRISLRWLATRRGRRPGRKHPMRSASLRMPGSIQRDLRCSPTAIRSHRPPNACHASCGKSVYRTSAPRGAPPVLRRRRTRHEATATRHQSQAISASNTSAVTSITVSISMCFPSHTFSFVMNEMIFHWLLATLSASSPSGLNRPCPIAEHAPVFWRRKPALRLS